MDRRSMLTGGTAFAALAGAAIFLRSSPPAEAAQGPFEVTMTDAEWRKKLTPEQYNILREQGTEPPFTSPLLNEHRAGIFHCAGCDLALFESSTKFESGTGWPSFYQPIANAVDVSTDTSFGMVRDEVHCHRCGGHLGHVFNDGPKPTGLRYCMDGLALTFEPKSA